MIIVISQESQRLNKPFPDFINGVVIYYMPKTKLYALLPTATIKMSYTVHILGFFFLLNFY